MSYAHGDDSYTYELYDSTTRDYLQSIEEAELDAYLAFVPTTSIYTVGMQLQHITRGTTETIVSIVTPLQSFAGGGGLQDCLYEVQDMNTLNWRTLNENIITAEYIILPQSLPNSNGALIAPRTGHSNLCTHEWVDTGTLLSFCKHCNMDKPRN